MAAHPDNASDARNQILAKAEPLFAANGFDGVSMREIAEACGMTKANLYYYFADKEALYLHVLERDLLATIDVLERAVADGGTARAQLTRITEAFAAIVQRKRSLLQMAMRHIGGPDGHIRGVFQRHRRRIVQLVEQALESGVRSGELRPLNVRLAAMSYMGMMFVYPKMLLENGPADVSETIVPHTIALYFDGIARR
jgi:AcrR family transcriptional regulator